MQHTLDHAPPTDTASTGTIDLEASDVTGQHRLRVHQVTEDQTVGELTRDLVGRMGLNRHDSNGIPFTYQARLESEDRFLHASDVIADVLKPNDRITLQPNIDAG